jgi:hypothetical protein
MGCEKLPAKDVRAKSIVYQGDTRYLDTGRIGKIAKLYGAIAAYQRILFHPLLSNRMPHAFFCYVIVRDIQMMH